MKLTNREEFYTYLDKTGADYRVNTEDGMKAYLKYISSEEYQNKLRIEACEQIAAYLQHSHEGITVTYRTDEHDFYFDGDIEQISKAIEVLNTIREE